MPAGGGAGGQPTDHMEFDLVLVRQQRFDKNRYPFAFLKSVVRFGAVASTAGGNAHSGIRAASQAAAG